MRRALTKAGPSATASLINRAKLVPSRGILPSRPVDLPRAPSKQLRGCAKFVPRSGSTTFS